MNDLPTSRTLKDALTEWAEPDEASYVLAMVLGIAPELTGESPPWGGKKWVFFCNNSLGEGLYKFLEMLARCGILEKNEEETKFRWNPKFEWAEYRETKEKRE